jgi:hypothetical protein
VLRDLIAKKVERSGHRLIPLVLGSITIVLVL